MKKALILAALSLMLVPRAGHAQFGVVYNPTNFHNAVLRYYQLRMQLAQLQQTYQQVVRQYNLAAQMARNLQNMPARYQAYFSQWRNLTHVPDVYQNTGTWVSAVNTGTQSTVATGYQQATEPLWKYSAKAVAAMTPEELQQAMSNYATVELADGANTNAMVTIGNVRANAQAIQNTIARLEQDSLSSDPSLNSQVGVLNKVNATNVLILRTLQDANNLRVSQLEQQVIQSKRQRDEAATAINADINQRDNMVKQVTQFTSGLENSLQNYRLP